MLNDRQSGATWAADDDYGLIDNWDALLEREHDEETIEQNDPDAEPTVEKSQVAPTAEDDAFGARPGRSTLLPVLLNDYDANGDVLVVDGVDGELPGGARLDLVSENQQLQLTLDEAASGALTFGYAVGDGRGGTAHAQVTVTVRDPDENGPPVQQRENRASVEVQGRVTTAVLGDWVDPDGDPFFLRSADGGGARRALLDRGGHRGVRRARRRRSHARRVAHRLRRPRAVDRGAHGRGEGARRRAPHRRAVRRARDRRRGDQDRPASPRPRRQRAHPPQRGAGQARRAADARLRRRHVPLHQLGRAHALPRVLRDRWHGHRDGPGPRRRVRAARPRHDADHRAPHGLPAPPAARRRRRARDRHRPDRRGAHRDRGHGPGRRRGRAGRGHRPPRPAGHPHAAARDRVDDLRLPREQRPRRSRGRGHGRRGAATRELPAAGRRARHHLRAHRRRRRDRRARQRRASRRAAAHARARPHHGPSRRAPVRRRRPVALLRSRSGGGVRGDLPRRRVRRAVRHGHRAHLGARGRPRDELGARAARPSPRA